MNGSEADYSEYGPISVSIINAEELTSYGISIHIGPLELGLSVSWWST
jgi:hypothetical protein